MTLTASVITFSLLILFANAADPQCGVGELVCNDARMGPTCYDPNTYTCPTGSRGTILCGNQEHGPDGACGYTCYDMVDYVCCDEQLYNAYDDSAPCAPSATPAATIPPPSDSIMCGAQRCLALYECCNDTVMGPTCFDPNGASCPIGSQGPVLCGFQKNGADAACGTVCYDFHEYQCCNDQLYGIDEDTPCSPSVTSAPTQAPTSAPTMAPTQAPTAAPTEVPTMSPTSMPTSAGTIPPSPDSMMCGQQRCLALYECCNDVRMGPTCYDPNGASCPVGSQGPILCGFQKNGADAACGTTCYDFHEYQCCNDQLYGIDETTPCSSGVTSAPTQSPTSAPTQMPTAQPTNAPTQLPTSAPTQAPTDAPTRSPTSPASDATIPPPADSIMCGEQRCLALYQCCNDTRMGPTCFDPNGASCPVGSQGPILCGFQKNGADAACGTTCYDFHEYQCCNDQLYGIDENTPCSPSVTSTPTSAPTTSPTAPTQAPTEAPTAAPTSAPGPIMCGGQQCLALYECCNDTRMGPTCFDPNGASCPVGSQGPILCGFQKNGADAACGTTCYDFHEYQCCNDKLYGIDEATPCTVDQMCGQSACGEGYECCMDAKLGATCYDPAAHSCPTGSQGPVLCGFGDNGADGTCGDVCYDMTDYKCCNDQLYASDDDSAPC